MRWFRAPNGNIYPLNEPVIRADYTGTGDTRTLVLSDGRHVRLREDPKGGLIGRESHFATCPNAAQHRRPL